MEPKQSKIQILSVSESPGSPLQLCPITMTTRLRCGLLPSSLLTQHPVPWRGLGLPGEQVNPPSRRLIGPLRNPPSVAHFCPGPSCCNYISLLVQERAGNVPAPANIFRAKGLTQRAFLSTCKYYDDSDSLLLGACESLLFITCLRDCLFYFINPIPITFQHSHQFIDSEQLRQLISAHSPDFHSIPAHPSAQS